MTRVASLISNILEYLVFLVFVLISRIVSFRNYQSIAKLIGLFFYYCIPIRKKVVRSNLQKAFPEKSAEEIEKIAKKNYIHFVTFFLEFLGLSSMKKSEIVNSVQTFDISFIKEKRKDGRALFILTAHFGNWELGGILAGILLNDPLSVLAKDQRNPFVTNWMNKTREKFGNKVISLGVSVRGIYQAVKDNLLIAIVGDQRGPNEGPRAFYFNQPTAVYTGTAAIALRTKTPIYIIFCFRDEKGLYKGIVEEINTTDLNGSQEEKELAVTQEYLNILEKYVRQYPEQWFWMHNIWKY